MGNGKRIKYTVDQSGVVHIIKQDNKKEIHR